MIKIEESSSYMIHDFRACGIIASGETKKDAIEDYKKRLTKEKEKLLKELDGIKEVEQEISLGNIR